MTDNKTSGGQPQDEQPQDDRAEAGDSSTQEDGSYPDDWEGTSSTSAQNQANRPGKRASGSLISDLIERRVPQVLAGYLGVTWTVFELMQWLTDQYLISPHLGRAVLFGLLMMAPAVVLVTYRHGRPGPDRWKPFERWGMVANAFLALVVLGFAYGDAELGSMTKAVQAGSSGTAGDSPSGETPGAAVRQVPKKEFRKRVSLFYFDKTEGMETSTDAEPDVGAAPNAVAEPDTALRRAAAHAVKKDFDQDDFITAHFIEAQSDELQARGYESGMDVPLGLKREIARKEGAEHIISGEVGKTTGGFRLAIQLHEVETGRQVAGHSFEGKDLFPLVDQATAELKKDLQLPKAHRKEATDLPVADVFTSSLEAAKHYATGKHLIETSRNREKAYSSFRRSTNVDSTFALALQYEAGVLWSLGRKEKAESTFRQAERHNYRLTESDQYALRAQILRWVENSPSSALKVCDRWTRLRPYDLKAWDMKAGIHTSQLQYEEALSAKQRMLELSPEDKNLRSEVASLLLSAGRIGDAVTRAGGLAAEYPEDGDVQVLLGLAHWRAGELGKAETAFQEAIRSNPNTVGSPTGSGTALLSNLYQAKGRFETAHGMLEKAADHENSSRLEGYRLWHHYWLRGQIDRSKAIFDSLRAAGVRLPKFHRAGLAKRACRFYLKTGENGPVQEALSDMKDLEEAFEGTVPSYEVMTHTISASCLATTDSLEKARYHLSVADSIVKETARLNMRRRYAIDYTRGRLHEAAGRFEEAVESYSTYKEVRPGFDFAANPTEGILPQYRKALSYQKMGSDTQAEEAYKRSLKIYPAHPYVNYHYGRFLVETGDTKQARPHLRRALEGWKPADSSFAPKQKARALLDSLSGGAV